jgi:hypothetical protein
METYRIVFEMPIIARDKLSEDEFLKVKDSLISYAVSLREESEIIQEKALKFNAEVKRIRDTYEANRVKLKENRLLEILTLTSDKLPMSYQFKIISYDEESRDAVHREDGTTLTKKEFHKHLFNEYVSELLDKYKKGEDTSSYINENLTS